MNLKQPISEFMNEVVQEFPHINQAKYLAIFEEHEIGTVEDLSALNDDEWRELIPAVATRHKFKTKVLGPEANRSISRLDLGVSLDVPDEEPDEKTPNGKKTEITVAAAPPMKLVEETSALTNDKSVSKNGNYDENSSPVHEKSHVQTAQTMTSQTNLTAQTSQSSQISQTTQASSPNITAQTEKPTASQNFVMALAQKHQTLITGSQTGNNNSNTLSPSGKRTIKTSTTGGARIENTTSETFGDPQRLFKTSITGGARIENTSEKFGDALSHRNSTKNTSSERLKPTPLAQSPPPRPQMAPPPYPQAQSPLRPRVSSLDFLPSTTLHETPQRKGALSARSFEGTPTRKIFNSSESPQHQYYSSPPHDAKTPKRLPRAYTEVSDTSSVTKRKKGSSGTPGREEEKRTMETKSKPKLNLQDADGPPPPRYVPPPPPESTGLQKAQSAEDVPSSSGFSTPDHFLRGSGNAKRKSQPSPGRKQTTPHGVIPRSADSESSSFESVFKDRTLHAEFSGYLAESFADGLLPLFSQLREFLNTKWKDRHQEMSMAKEIAGKLGAGGKAVFALDDRSLNHVKDEIANDQIPIRSFHRALDDLDIIITAHFLDFCKKRAAASQAEKKQRRFSGKRRKPGEVWSAKTLSPRKYDGVAELPKRLPDSFEDDSLREEFLEFLCKMLYEERFALYQNVQAFGKAKFERKTQLFETAQHIANALGLGGNLKVTISKSREKEIIDKLKEKEKIDSTLFLDVQDILHQEMEAKWTDFVTWKSSASGSAKNSNGVKNEKKAARTTNAKAKSDTPPKGKERPLEENEKFMSPKELERTILKMTDRIDGVEVKDRKHNSKIVNDCFTGSDAVTWLLTQFPSWDRARATRFCQALMDDEVISPAGQRKKFVDSDTAYYIFPIFPRSAVRSTPEKGFGASGPPLNIDFDRRISQVVSKARDLNYGFELKDRTLHLKKYKNCFVASEAVSWLVNELKLKSRMEGVLWGKKMQEIDVIKPLGGQFQFGDDKHLLFKWSHPVEGDVKYDVL